ncbi:MAG: hypothetical protein AVDCRST_MAG73-1302, partial [uncultured Thermomicrobiales bacterium]
AGVGRAAGGKPRRDGRLGLVRRRGGRHQVGRGGRFPARAGGAPVRPRRADLVWGACPVRCHKAQAGTARSAARRVPGRDPVCRLSAAVQRRAPPDDGVTGGGDAGDDAPLERGLWAVFRPRGTDPPPGFGCRAFVRRRRRGVRAGRGGWLVVRCRRQRVDAAGRRRRRALRRVRQTAAPALPGRPPDRLHDDPRRRDAAPLRGRRRVRGGGAGPGRADPTPRALPGRAGRRRRLFLDQLRVGPAFPDPVHGLHQPQSARRRRARRDPARRIAVGVVRTRVRDRGGGGRADQLAANARATWLSPATRFATSPL